MHAKTILGGTKPDRGHKKRLGHKATKNARGQKATKNVRGHKNAIGGTKMLGGTKNSKTLGAQKTPGEINLRAA